MYNIYNLCIYKNNVNQIENVITFKIKKGYYLQNVLPEIINLLGGTKNKINQGKNGEKVPH